MHEASPSDAPPAAVRTSRELLRRIRDDIARQRFGVDGYLGTEVEMARETGLSRMTVRKAVDTLAHEGVVERRVAKGVFVRPNAVLRGVIQVIVPSLEQCMPRRIARGARERARETESYMLIYDADFASDYEVERLRLLPMSGARGAIIVSPHELSFDALLESFDGVGFPYILVDDEPGRFAAASVQSDHRQGGLLIGRALAARGYRRAALVFDENIRPAHLRRDGFLAAWAEAGLPFDPAGFESLHRPADWRYAGPGRTHWTHGAIRARVASLLARGSAAPDVYVCENDFMACATLDALAERGVRVPADAGVTGFDHTPDVAGRSPGLFTVEQDMEGLGRAAMAMLAEQIRIGRRPADRVLPVRLVEGGTVREGPPGA